MRRRHRRRLLSLGVGTSAFEHKDAEEQSTFRAGEFVGEHLAPLLPNPPQVTAGEVVAYKTK